MFKIQKPTKEGLSFKKIALISGGSLAAVILALNSYHIVPRGTIGVQQLFGEVQTELLPEGLHFVDPRKTFYDYNIKLNVTASKNAQGGTKDQQVVHTDITVNYAFDPKKVGYTLGHFGTEDYIQAAFVNPAVAEVFKAVTAEYTSEELITKRSEVNIGIVRKLQDKLSKYNIVVSDINLVNFGFSDGYQRAIEEKVIAHQRKQKAEQDLARIEVEAKQAIAVAEGRAKAIAAESKAIEAAGGKAYIDMKAIEKWNGVLPTMVGTGAVPFVNLK